MIKGLFDLTGLDTMSESTEIKLNDSILDMNINESSEFDEVGIPVPGGLSESPSSKPYDLSDIKIPSGTTISSSEYNSALSMLQKSFKEGYEAMGMLMNATVVNDSIESLQEAATQEAIGKAIVESFENGPMFEAVRIKDKNKIKSIVSTLRDKLDKDLTNDDLEFYKPSLWGRILSGFIPLIGSMNFVSAIEIAWSTRLWQILGVCIVESGNVEKLCENLTEKYKDELGDYKILGTEVKPSILDVFRAQFNFKNHKSAYLLVVDKKLSSEIDKMQKTIDDNIKKVEEAAKKEEK